MLGAAAKALQALCVALSLVFVLAVLVAYAPALRSGYEVGLGDFLILFPTFFATLLPASYAFRRKHWREYTVMTASFGWALAMAFWYASLVTWYLTEGFSARMIFREGFPGNALNCIAIILFAANGLLALKSLRHRRLPA